MAAERGPTARLILDGVDPVAHFPGRARRGRGARAAVACVGTAATWIPITYLAEGNGLSDPAGLALAMAAAVPAYLLTLRATAPAAWRDLKALVARVVAAAAIPARARRSPATEPPPPGFST